MEQLKSFLSGVCGDIFKLLPMKEAEGEGVINHIDEYIDAIIVNMTGAMRTYPVLATEKRYLYVVNNLNYLRDNPVDFQKWRKIVLNSTGIINGLYEYCGG